MDNSGLQNIPFSFKNKNCPFPHKKCPIMNSFKINKLMFNHIYRVLQDYKFVASTLCNYL